MGICSLRKKTARLACAAGIGALCAAVLLGCNGVILPKKVNVIADPTFNVGIGSAEEKLDDYASAEKIQDMLGGDTDGMTVYDYNPNNSSNDLQQFAVFYDMGTFDIDVNEALDAANVESTNVEIPEQTIAIPTIKIEYSRNLTTSGNSVQLPDDVKLPVDFSFDGAEMSSEDVEVTEVNASGNIEIAIDGVNGADFSKVKLSIGGQDITAVNSGGKWSFPLSDTPLVSENGGYALSGSITIPGGASIPGNAELTVTGKIDTINSVLVKLPDEITKQFSQSVEPIDLSDLDGLVEKIVFSRVGAEGHFVSTLPEGNDITIKVSTEPVGLFNPEEDKIKIEGGRGDTEQEIPLIREGAELTAADLADHGWQLPFTVKIELPSEQRDGQTLYRFTDVAPGAAYTLSGSLTSVMEWESITLTKDAFGKFAGEGEDNPLNDSMELDIGLSELKTDIEEMIKDIAVDAPLIGDLIEFSGIKAYPFITKPSGVLTDVAAEGEIKLVGDDDASKTQFLLEAGTEITLLDSRPPLPDKPGTMITTDFSAVPVSAEMEHDALTGMLNEYPDKLTVEYNISITGQGGGNVTITKAELGNLDEGGKLSISASLIIVVPLELKLPNDVAAVTISLSEALAGEDEPSDKDLLGREKPVGTDDKINENLDKLIRSLDTLSVAVSYKNRLGVNLDATLTNTPELVKAPDGWVPLPKDEKETYMLNKAFTIDAAEGKADIVNIVGADILDKVLYAYPFNPKVVITVTGTKGEDGESYIKIPRNALFGASVSLAAGVSINGVYDFSTGEFVL